MVAVSDMIQTYAFVAVIHKKNVDNKKQFDRVVKECMFAKAVDKPMYAVVEKGIDIGVLSDMPWKKMVHFNKKSDVSGILKFIDDDIMAGGFYT